MARKNSTVEWRSMKEQGAAEEKAKKGKVVDKLNALKRRPEWWTVDEKKPDQVTGAIKAVLRHMQQTQSSLEQQRNICVRLYGGLVPGMHYGSQLDRTQTIHPSVAGRLTYNLTAIVVDSLMSKITKNRVRPYFLTQGGNYRMQRRAKKLSQFAEGLFYETRFDELAPVIFRDGAVMGDGLVHVYEDPTSERVVIERVMPYELYVDMIDGMYGEPQQMHRVKNIDRQKVLAAFGEHGDNEKTILACNPSGTEFTGTPYQFVTDSIAVAESWHLPSGPGAKDGRHVISIDSGVLVDEPWEKDYFPFAKFSWKPRIYGWHGSSLVEELIGTQVEMNYLLHMMQRAFRMMAGFKIVVENGTIPDGHFNDKLGTILHLPKGGQMPQYISPTALNPQYFDHFERIKARGFEIARLSQMSAVGMKPAGLDSGEAQRVYHDIESEGFQYVGHAYEQFHLDVIALAIDVVRDIYTRKGDGYKLRAPVASYSMPGNRFLREMNWSEVNMKEDEYVLRAYPTSALPSTPAGKLAQVNDLARAGYIDEATARKLMDFPDLTQVQTLLGAAEDWVMKCLDAIIEDDKFIAPSPLMNLQLAETLCVQEIALGSATDMEEDKLGELERWLSQVKFLQGKGATAAPMAAQPGQVASSAGVGVVPDMGATGPTGGALQGQPMPPGASPAAPMPMGGMPAGPLPQ